MYNFGTDGTDGIPYPDSQWDSEVVQSSSPLKWCQLSKVELCKKSVEILNNMQPRPAFFVVCGDLVDAFGDKHPEIRARQEADLKKVYSKLDPAIPMICVCGNHDVGNSPTPETIARWKVDPEKSTVMLRQANIKVIQVQGVVWRRLFLILQERCRLPRIELAVLCGLDKRSRWIQSARDLAGTRVE